MKDGNLIVTMPDGTKWAVPIYAIALDRARHYAHEYGGDTHRALIEDTYPLFEADAYEVHDWAANNMNWDDVKGDARQVEGPAPVDYQEGWVNGDHKVVWG